MRFGNWNKRRKSQRNPIGGRRAAKQTSQHCEHLERRQLLSSMTFKFSLDTGAGTKCGGVYNSTGTMVRTLWSGEKMQPGMYQETWDGNTDAGSPAGAGTYTVKVLYNNVKDTWEGVIGNTSASFVGASSWDENNEIVGMAFNGSGSTYTAYTANAYEERTTLTDTFNNVSGPQSPTRLAVPVPDEVNLTLTESWRPTGRGRITRIQVPVFRTLSCSPLIRLMTPCIHSAAGAVSESIWYTLSARSATVTPQATHRGFGGANWRHFWPSLAVPLTVSNYTTKPPELR